MIAIFSILILSIVVTGCRLWGKDTAKPVDTTAQIEVTTAEPAATIVDPSTDPSTLDDITLDALTADILTDMTVEEKVGQLFIVNIEQLEPAPGKSYKYYEITSTMKKNMEKYHIGGYIFFSRNLKSREQTKTFIKNLQGVSKIPLFISVDEEGGAVSRIGKNKKMGTTYFPPMQEIGDTGSPTEAFEVGNTIGQEIRELGFNLDFAPIADLLVNESNTEIGDRSFGSDPKMVGEMVAEMVRGLQGQGVSATLKHFPGHGGASGDTHKGYADITNSIQELRKVEFIPFKAGIKVGADLIMVSHLAVTNVTNETVPASLSPLILEDILRTELGYENIIITDALNMKSITNEYTSGEAAVTAISAGADILLMPKDFEDAYEELLEAVKNGDIKESRIDKSISRILRIKLKRGVIPLDSPLISSNKIK